MVILIIENIIKKIRKKREWKISLVFSTKLKAFFSAFYRRYFLYARTGISSSAFFLFYKKKECLGLEERKTANRKSDWLRQIAFWAICPFSFFPPVAFFLLERERKGCFEPGSRAPQAPRIIHYPIRATNIETL